MRFRPLPVLWLLVMLAAASGCSSSPTVLTGDPTQTGLLIIDAYVKKSMLIGSARSRVTEGLVVREGSYETKKGYEAAGYVVFSGLPPGRYRVSRVRGRSSIWTNWETWEYVITNPDPDLTITVPAGDVAYLGHLEVWDRAGFDGVGYDFRLLPAPKREKRALEKLLKEYRDSPWADTIRRKLNSLEASPARSPRG